MRTDWLVATGLKAVLCSILNKEGFWGISWQHEKKLPSMINILARGYFQLSFSFFTIQNTLKSQAFYVNYSPKNHNFIKDKMSPFWVLIHRFNPRIHILFAAFIDLYLRHFLHLFNFISSKLNGITLKRSPSMGLNKKNTKIHRDNQFPSQSDSIHKIYEKKNNNSSLFAGGATLWRASLVIANFNFNWAKQIFWFHLWFFIHIPSKCALKTLPCQEKTQFFFLPFNLLSLLKFKIVMAEIIPE